MPGVPLAIDLQPHVGRERDLPGVHPENPLPAPHVGRVHHDLAVEPAGTQQRRIEHVGPVGGGDQDDAVVGLEAVHLDQQLIEGLLPLVVAAAQAGAPMAADGVDLVDEDDAGRMALALLEEVAHPARAHADEHLDEVGAGHGEERPARLTRHGLGQQGLAGARRADQQRALGEPAAQPGELLRVLEELDDLLQLDLGLVGAGHVGEGDLRRVAGQQLGLRLPEREGPVAPAWICRSRKNQRPRITIQGSAAMMIAVMPPFGSLARMGTPGILEALDERPRCWPPAGAR